MPKTGNNDKIFLLNEKYVCLEIMFLLNLSKSWKHMTCFHSFDECNTVFLFSYDPNIKERELDNA